MDRRLEYSVAYTLLSAIKIMMLETTVTQELIKLASSRTIPKALLDRAKDGEIARAQFVGAMEGVLRQIHEAAKKDINDGQETQ